MTVILVAQDESFRQHLHQKLLQADCEDVRWAEPAADFAPLLFECKDAVVVLGGRWPELRASLRRAARAEARAILILQQPVASGEATREALEIGARAVLHAEISKPALKAALAATHAGLIVLDSPSPLGIPSLAARSEDPWASAFKVRRDSLNPDPIPQEPSHRTGRQLTLRERKILSLVASGISNKGAARSLGVSVNTVKFHLAAAFEKLNAATRAEAVTEAIRRGELSL